MPSPASKISRIFVQETTKILSKVTAYHCSVLHTPVTIKDNLSVQKDRLSLSLLVTVWWLPPALLYQSDNTRTLLKGLLSL